MKKILYSLLIVAASLTVSCDLDINKDPYDVTKLDFAQLLTATEYEVAASFAEGNYLNANFASYTHHTVSREVNNYSLTAGYSTLGNTWQQCYLSATKNADALISLGDAQGDKSYAAIGRILKAYMFTNMVDLWGDIPYSEYNVNGNQAPHPDKGEDIYNACFTLLDEALTALAAPEGLEPAANDLIYKGDLEKWIKLANTLKLRMYVQTRKASDKITGWDAGLSALLAANKFLANDEDFQFPHTATTSPLDERKSGFYDEYYASQKSVWISPWMHEIMTGAIYNFTENPLSGIVDPRCPYYWYNQISATKAAQNKTDYRDGAFVSILFASNSGLDSGNQDASMSVIGIYPVGGKFDDGSAAKVTSASGSGIAPDKMVQAYSVPFMKAELALAGKYAAGNAKTLLKEGIDAAFYHVNAVTKEADATAPKITDAVRDTYRDAVLAKFDAGSADKKMEIVMTEKWIANIYNSVEAYNDIRRTGFPKLFTGKNGKGYSPYANEEAATPTLTYPYTEINLKTIAAYPRVMWYPEDETKANPNIVNTDRVVSDRTVFWDVQ